MIDINNMGLTPNQNINRLSKEQLISLFSELWNNITTWKGLYYKEERAVPAIGMLCDRVYRNYDNLTVNDIVVAIEKSMAYDEVTKLSPEYFVKIIQKTNNEKREIEGNINKKNNSGIFDSNWGKAINIRLLYDPKGKIMDEQEFTLKDIYEAVLNGFNIYNSQPVEKNTNITGRVNL